MSNNVIEVATSVGKVGKKNKKFSVKHIEPIQQLAVVDEYLINFKISIYTKLNIMISLDNSFLDLSSDKVLSFKEGYKNEILLHQHLSELKERKNTLYKLTMFYNVIDFLLSHKDPYLRIFNLNKFVTNYSGNILVSIKDDVKIIKFADCEKSILFKSENNQILEKFFLQMSSAAKKIEEQYSKVLVDYGYKWVDQVKKLAEIDPKCDNNY